MADPDVSAVAQETQRLRADLITAGAVPEAYDYDTLLAYFDKVAAVCDTYQDADDRYEEGYDDGYDKGHDAGYDDGYDDGVEEGRAEAESEL